MSRRSDIDWEAIEREYRLGQKSNKQIAIEHGVQPSTIGRRAEKYEWVQDKSAEVRARSANLLVMIDAKKANGKANSNATPSVTDVRIAVQTRVEVVLGHRKYARRALNLAEVMLGDLELTSSPEGVGLIETLMDAVKTPEESESEEDRTRRRRKQNDALNKALGLSERVDTLKRLSETVDRLVQIERQAFGINDKAPLEEQEGKVLNDAERASRASSILAMALQRRAEQQLAPTDAS